MRRYVMEFERPLVELETTLAELRKLDVADNPELVAEIEELTAEIERLRIETYTDLTPWQRVQISRHPHRPHTQDYVAALFEDVVEVHGDRRYGDDAAMFAGLARMGNRHLAVLGHRKGSTTKENLAYHFGSPHPEGFRKAARVMRLADKFALPLVTFLDTAGAYPGIEAEERGQGWAIAEAIATLSSVEVPVVVVAIGEGGSGGALAIGFGDRLIMLENAYYSVASPEAAASILYKDSTHAEEIAGRMKLTAADLVELGIADEIVEEPLGGAHVDPGAVFDAVGVRIAAALHELGGMAGDKLRDARNERLRSVGVYRDEGPKG